MSIDFDDVRSVPRTVVFSETGHRALLQLFDPLDFSLKAIANIDGEARVLGIENIPLRTPFESVGVGFDEVFESVDLSVELAHFGRVVILSLFDCFEQCLGDPLQSVGVKIGAAVKDVSGRSG